MLNKYSVKNIQLQNQEPGYRMYFALRSDKACRRSHMAGSSVPIITSWKVNTTAPGIFSCPGHRCQAV
jgi:hypothetical protein